MNAKHLLFLLQVLCFLSIRAMEKSDDDEPKSALDAYELQDFSCDRDEVQDIDIIKIIANQMFESNKGCDCGFIAFNQQLLEDHLLLCEQFLESYHRFYYEDDYSKMSFSAEQNTDVFLLNATKDGYNESVFEQFFGNELFVLDRVLNFEQTDYGSAGNVSTVDNLGMLPVEALVASDVQRSPDEKKKLIKESRCFEPKITRCMCGFTGKNTSDLLLHIKNKHVVKIGGKIFYECQYEDCKQKRLEGPKNAAYHYRTHTKEDVQFKCPFPECSKTYRTRYALCSHLKNKHDVANLHYYSSTHSAKHDDHDDSDLLGLPAQKESCHSSFGTTERRDLEDCLYTYEGSLDNFSENRDALTSEEIVRLIQESECLDRQETKCVCGFQEEDSKVLLSHVQQCHKKETNHGNWYICTFTDCEKKKWHHLNRAIDHYRTHTQEEVDYKCPIPACIFHSRSYQYFLKHLNEKHGFKQRKAPGAGEQDNAILPQSGLETVNNQLGKDACLSPYEKMKLIKESRCFESKMTRCMCGFIGKNNEDLIQHIKDKHVVKSGKKTHYVCEHKDCKQRRLQGPKKAAQHYRTHTKEKEQFKCPFPPCPKNYSVPYCLSTHLKNRHGIDNSMEIAPQQDKEKSDREMLSIPLQNLFDDELFNLNPEKEESHDEQTITNKKRKRKAVKSVAQKKPKQLKESNPPETYVCCCGSNFTDLTVFRHHIKNHRKKIGKKHYYICTKPDCEDRKFDCPGKAIPHYKRHERESS